MAFNPMGTTALITGASSGLGAEFARRLGERGTDLVLVARRQDRLEALAVELAEKYGTVSTVVPLDLTAPGAVNELVDDLAIRDIRPATLVHSVGFGTHGPFLSLDASRLDREIELNVQSVVALTHALLPTLLSQAAVNPGNAALVTLASTVAYQPVPNFAVYAATKSFVLSFTEALWYELRGRGLKVLALSPGPTETEFFAVAGNRKSSSGRFETPEHVLDTAFCALDRRRTPPSVISGARNSVLAAATRLGSRRTVVTAAGRMGEHGR